jgi:hypothetical protein
MKIHRPLTFEEESFRLTPLGDAPAGAVGHALVALHESRAFFMTGAGSSAGAPTGLPTGPQLAERLGKWARDTGFGDEVEALADQRDLGQVCEVLEGAMGRVDVVRYIRRNVDWEDSEFNLCHFAIALFYAEEVVKLSFTANWDPKLEDAICRVAGRQQPRIARNRQTMGEVGTDPCLVHMHGHCQDPDSLVMTSKELKGPDTLKWTDPSLRAALTKQDPIFVGFAAEPEYVIESLREMRAEMERPPASVIGIETAAKFSADSAALAEALKLDEDKDRYVQGEACEVMGELLRCCYRKRIDQVLADAETRAGVGAGTRRVLSAAGAATVRSAIEALSTEKLLALLWSATAKVDNDGASRQASIAKISSELAETLAVLMVLTSCDDAREIAVSRGGFRLSRADGTAVDLWPAIPEDYLSPTDAQARIYRHSDRFSGPADANVPLVLICAGTTGALPNSSKVSLIGEAAPTNVGAAQRAPVRVIDLNELDRRFSDTEKQKTLADGLRL